MCNTYGKNIKPLTTIFLENRANKKGGIYLEIEKVEFPLK
jgi:hypothetical protein